MFLIEILETVFIRPLSLLFELIFGLSYRFIQEPALNLIIMSLAINLLVLPLYRRADRLQMKVRDKEEAIRPMAEHIKKYFKGDEKVMILRAFYREEDYSPLSSLKGIVSLLLQIPFFMAAYQFLSNLSLLEGQHIGPIKDLMQPDGLIVIGSISINLLPILMTVINIISSEIYAKGLPFSKKAVMYLSALIFLVLLYDSPSGLVFYWTMNNVFSLVKNIAYKIIKPRDEQADKEKTTGLYEKYQFFSSALYMAILTGLLITSATVSSSPLDFLFINNIKSPLQYVWYTFEIAVGVFVVWFGVFFFLGTDRAKHMFSMMMFALIGGASFNYFVFGSGMGIVSTEFVFDYDIACGTDVMIITTLTSVIIFVLFAMIYKFFRKIAFYIVMAGLLAATVMSITNIVKIEKAYADSASIEVRETDYSIPLSREEKNVVVIMLDRAIGSYVPFIFNEAKGLEEQYDGFTFYPNTISFGQYTNFGVPALFGGYEYTPERLNERTGELLRDKHNEALKVMPYLFCEAGYDVTVVNPPYVNYREVPDTSIFDGMDINAFIAEVGLNPYYDEINDYLDDNRSRNFFLYSLLKVSPTFLQPYIYGGGSYNSLDRKWIETDDGRFIFPQIHESTSVTHGVNPDYLKAYMTLENISDATKFTDDGNGSFLTINNTSTHSPIILQTPDYTLSNDVDNTAYEALHPGRMLPDGRTLALEDYIQMAHYHANYAAFRQLGNWFDYLRDNGVWDNTRIIIVADHGRSLFQDNRLIIEEIMFDAESVNPVLMVKDFNDTGFTTSDVFMTNADVPTIALEGVIEDPVNPFTGNHINSIPKTEEQQHILISENWRVQENNGNVFLPGSWYTVHDSIFDGSNWAYLGDH